VQETTAALEPLEAVRSPAGLLLRGTQLVLDPRGRSPLGFLASAHTSRAELPERVIATTATLSLLEATQPGRLVRSAPLPALPGQAFSLGSHRFSLLSSGCLRGSAFLRAEQDGKVVVWGADMGGSGTRAVKTAEPRAAVHCDTLILRAVHGHPQCVFPPRGPLFEQLFAFVEGTLKDGLTPVVLAAPLGGAQEAAKLLGDRGHKLRLHPALHRAALAYEKLGVVFQDLEPFEGPPAPGEVVILPYGARAGRRGPVGAHRAVLLSGRAVEPGICERAGVELALPISDHAGFDELVELALQSDAQRVITVEGFAAELAEALRERGLEAHALGAERQLELF
jgi:putative mRNA 3-end processing factor